MGLQRVGCNLVTEQQQHGRNKNPHIWWLNSSPHAWFPVRPNKPKQQSLEQRKVYCRASAKENGQLMLKRPKLSDGFQGRIFKGDTWGKGCRGHTFLLMGWWWGKRVMRNLHHPLPGSIHSGISARVLSIKSTSFTGLGPLFLENNLKACFRSLCLSLEEEVGFCFITALCFLTTFNSFLHSLTFLISNCLKLLFVTQGKPRRPKPFCKSKRWGHRTTFVPRRVQQSPWFQCPPYPVFLWFFLLVLRGKAPGQERK